MTEYRPITKDEAISIARCAVVFRGRPERPDKMRVIESVLVLSDLEEREKRAIRGAEWCHGMVLWHMSRGHRLNSLDDWQAAIDWGSMGSDLATMAMFAAIERDKEDGEGRRLFHVEPSALLLFGVSVGVALCVLLRMAGY